jgi:peptidoglycan/LPS O-acetylase OafA/YrhL
VEPRLPGWLSPIKCVLIIWAVAALSYELVEEPALRWKRKFEAIRVENAEGELVTAEA